VRLVSRYFVLSYFCAFPALAVVLGMSRPALVFALLALLTISPGELRRRWANRVGDVAAVAASSAALFSIALTSATNLALFAFGAVLLAGWRAVRTFAARSNLSRRELRKRLAFSGITTALFFAGAELLLAVFSAAYFRAAGRPEEGAFRVLALGDSFTYGQYVAPELSYPVQLQRELDARGAGWQILNHGHPGDSPMMIYQALPEVLDQTRPQLVLLLAGFNVNDADIREYRRAEPALSDDVRTSSVVDVNLLLSRLRLYRLLRYAVVHYVDRPFRISQDYAPGGMALFSFSNYQRTNHFGMERVLLELRRRAIPVVLLNYPQAPVPPNPISRDEYYVVIFAEHLPKPTIGAEDYLFVRHSPRETAINGLIRYLATEHGIPLVDNFTDFDSLPDKSRYFIEGDEHPNGIGYARVVQNVIAELDRQGMLPSAKETAP
jgi:lysophospholipase L1-like esterase